MSIADYVIVAVVILAAIGALWYARRHPSCGGCQGGCAACQKSCASRQEPAAGPNEKE